METTKATVASPAGEQSPMKDDLMQILLAEQKHIDGRIQAMMELQMKILAFLFPALGVAAGWIFTADKGAQSSSTGMPVREAALLVLITVTCFGILLSVICYSVSAEYSRYKSAVLGPRFQKLLGQPENPLDGGSWGKSYLGKVLTFATIGLWITVAFALSIILWVATTTWQRWPDRPFPGLLALISCYLFAGLAIASVVISLARPTWWRR